MQPVDFLPIWLAEILFWVYYNQTLIAGVAATGAAVLTISELRKQRTEEYSRRHRMLRAGLPTALSAITEYAERCLRLFLANLDEGGILEMPPLPNEAYQNVQAVIETADDPVAADLERLLRFGQIQHSRLRSHIEDADETQIVTTAGKPSEHQRRRIYSLVLDALFLHNSVSRLYEYARGESDQAKSWRDETTAENLLFTFSHPTGGFVRDRGPLEQYVRRYWMSLVKADGLPKTH